MRIALKSGLSRQQVADNLVEGKPTLNEWLTAHRGTDVISSEDRELARERLASVSETDVQAQNPNDAHGAQ